MLVSFSFAFMKFMKLQKNIFQLLPKMVNKNKMQLLFKWKWKDLRVFWDAAAADEHKAIFYLRIYMGIILFLCIHIIQRTKHHEWNEWWDPFLLCIPIQIFLLHEFYLNKVFSLAHWTCLVRELFYCYYDLRKWKKC